MWHNSIIAHNAKRQVKETYDLAQRFKLEKKRRQERIPVATGNVFSFLAERGARGCTPRTFYNSVM
jgi:hypothetical protein